MSMQGQTQAGSLNCVSQHIDRFTVFNFESNLQEELDPNGMVEHVLTF